MVTRRQCTGKRFVRFHSTSPRQPSVYRRVCVVQRKYGVYVDLLGNAQWRQRMAQSSVCPPSLPKIMWPCIYLIEHICWVWAAIIFSTVKSLAMLSWKTQPDIVTYNHPHTHAYTTSPALHHSTIPLSPYSSLAGALDLSPAKSRLRSSVRLFINKKLTMRTRADFPVYQAIRKARTSTHKGNPYPVSHHDPPYSPTRARGHTRANSHILLADRSGAPSRSSGGGGHHGHDGSFQPVRIIMHPRWPNGPTNHVLVPQKLFTEECMYADPHFRHPSINFQAVGIPELGVRVASIMDKYAPAIVGGNDPVFADSGEREVRIWIMVCCPHRALDKPIVHSFRCCSGRGTILSLCRRELRPTTAR
jgi:hypothetical protein